MVCIFFYIYTNVLWHLAILPTFRGPFRTAVNQCRLTICEGAVDLEELFLPMFGYPA